MVMRLRPPGLGDVTVRVAVNGRDVSAWFASPQPEVQSAISAAIGQLQTTLGDAGYNLNGAWVGADASSARQQGASLPPAPPTRASPAAPAIGLSTTASSRPAAAGLNIYV
jgi:flagellar hook-length control protein FliK